MRADEDPDLGACLVAMFVAPRRCLFRNEKILRRTLHVSPVGEHSINALLIYTQRFYFKLRRKRDRS